MSVHQVTNQYLRRHNEILSESYWYLTLRDKRLNEEIGVKTQIPVVYYHDKISKLAAQNM